MSKDFKSTVDDTLARQVAKKQAVVEEKKKIAREKEQVSKITEQFSDTFMVEKITYKIKEQMAEDFRQELEEGLAVQIAESVRQEITESVRKELTVELDERVIESNESLIKVINTLAEKMERINESLNVEVPTPIVHVNMPKITRKVNRNEDGTVDSITEEFEKRQRGIVDWLIIPS